MTNYLTEYWDRLNKMDPRLRTIFIDLDDENCTGRVGTNQNFVGDMIYRIYKVAKDAKDFKTLYIAAHDDTDENLWRIKNDAMVWWNVVTKVKNDTAHEIADALEKRR